MAISKKTALKQLATKIANAKVAVAKANAAGLTVGGADVLGGVAIFKVGTLTLINGTSGLNNDVWYIGGLANMSWEISDAIKQAISRQ